MLFILGQYYRVMKKKFNIDFLEVVISKTDYISLVMKSGMVSKKERAIYKNLELLEKKKLVQYKNKMLRLTPKGNRIFNEINKEIQPFIDVVETIENKRVIEYTKKPQTIFK